MEAPSLTLRLSDKTFKKLRVLAMLSDVTMDQLEKNFVDYFDEMLTENISTLLAELDGKEYVPQKVEAQPSVTTERVEENEPENGGSEVPEHALSDDDLPEEVRSTAELVEDDIQPPQYQAPNAGGNAESFLDAALSQPERKVRVETPKASYMGMPVNNPKKAFSPGAPRARVSEYTGDEVDLL